jgi:hypothetical protein
MNNSEYEEKSGTKTVYYNRGPRTVYKRENKE